jgi:cellulose synthase/poly-beta-1,6-N-acetylglucosamine synthase-like glycosyltransferase
MDKVSILIPARGERWSNLKRTIESIYENATGEIEIIVGIDGVFGHWGTGEELELTFNDINLHDHFPDVKVIPFPSVVGIKTNINAMAAMATGKYIYKSDAHCRLSKGFDEVLKADMEDDWIVMPRFKIITEDWEIQMRNGQEEFYDYFYLCCPFTDPKGFRFKAGGHWGELTKENDFDTLVEHNNGDETEAHQLLIDETPQIHGSGWFMTRDRYFELGGFPNIDPHGHAQEPIWLAMKNWMAGGKVMVNKKCWYAHLHQQGNKRGYHMDREQEKRSYDIAAKYFVGDKWDDTWPKKVMTFEEFVSKFMPMPGWPDNWRELCGRAYMEINYPPKII